MVSMTKVNNRLTRHGTEDSLAKISSIMFVGVSIAYLYLSMLRDVVPSGTNLVLGALLIVSVIPALHKDKDYLALILLCIGEMVTLFYVSNIVQSVDIFANALFAVEVFIAIQNHSFREQTICFLRGSSALNAVLLYGYPVFMLSLILTPSCWSFKDAWDGVYFTAFTVEQAVAANSCAYIAFALYLMSQKEKSLFALAGIALNCYVIVVSGARIFVISAVILIFFGVRLFVKSRKAKRNAGIVMAGATSVAIASSGSFQAKMENALSLQNVAGFTFVDALTNSRTIFWANDLRAYLLSNNVVQIFFGCGHDFVYKINHIYSGYEFWAHNDFIQMLVGQGLVGLLVYLYCVTGCISNLKRFLSGRLEYVLLLIYVIGCAFLNGILVYPNYCISLVFFALFLQITAEVSEDGSR